MKEKIGSQYLSVLEVMNKFNEQSVMTLKTKLTTEVSQKLNFLLEQFSCKLAVALATVTVHIYRQLQTLSNSILLLFFVWSVLVFCLCFVGFF